MNFGLKKPCPNCPFRSDIPAYLTAERVEEIDESLERGTFACHKTTEFDDEGEHLPHEGEQHCAGALILLEKLGRPSQMMRIYERLGCYDHQKLQMDAPVFDSFEEMEDAQP